MNFTEWVQKKNKKNSEMKLVAKRLARNLFNWSQNLQVFFYKFNYFLPTNIFINDFLPPSALMICTIQKPAKPLATDCADF